MKELIANGYGIAVNVSLAILAVLCVGLAVRWLIQKSWLVASGVLIDICGRNFNWLVFAFAVVGACLYGGAKNGAGQEALNGLGLNGSLLGTNAQHGRSDSDFTADSPEDNLSFISFSMSSNIVSFGLSWKTNFSPARAWLELYEKLHSLTNPWLPRLVRELPAHATNDAFTVTFTNDVPPAAFYSVHMDSLHVDFPDVEMTESADGRRVYTSFGPKSFAVAVNRPQRPDGFPPFDPAFAVNPFVYVDGLTYDPDASTLRADGYGVYELPDGSVLAAFADPKVSFGSSHDYVGTTLSYDSGSYAKSSPYPLSTPSLQKGWSRGTTPGTGCSCVPSVDFGGGLVVQGSSGTALRANGTGLPPGMWADYEYADGGVWVTLYNHTNVVWRKWCEHRRYADNGGTSDELGGPQDEDTCDCGDENALEGSSAGSVRFRIPLGSANVGEVSGFLYFNRNAPFDVTPSAFELLCRGDAYVTDNYGPDGTRTVICRARHGRKIVVRGNDGGDGVDIEVRDTASDDLLHTWTVTRDGSTIRIVQISVLDNTMQDKSYTYDDGEWTETDNISGLSDQRIVQDRLNGDGTLREERVVTCAEKVAIHVITESRRFGTGTNAVLRETERRELGVDETWKVARASYWEDTAHPRRHGSLRLEQGDDRAWNYRAYDDEGRLVFRMDQRDGSEVPADALDYSITNLPPVSAAFATTYDYSPLAGDEGRSNDWKKVRTESKYVVENGAAILIGRTWNTYGRGTSDGYPTIVRTKERAASQTAQQGDAGNAVSISSIFDDESEAVPYVLRGELASETDEDGVTTRYERTGVRGVLRTVERKFFNGNERKTRRVTEQDWNYGNLLYEAEAITADGTEFGWARHAYDEKNRLRFTQYDDGSWETNAYSCCRLLWTIDRTGAKRRRDALTGQDNLSCTEVDEFVVGLPKEGVHVYRPWTGSLFENDVPVFRRNFDGLGRETNTVASFARYTTDVGDRRNSVAYRGFAAFSSTVYPQGVSDVFERTDARGKRTSQSVFESASEKLTVICDYAPESSEPLLVVTNVMIRGGASEVWRGTSGKWSNRKTHDAYGSDGCRTKYDIEESSDRGIVTNSIDSLDFLGRVEGRESPNSSVEYAYDGCSSRVLGSHDAVSGLSVVNVYDECGETIGNESCGVLLERRGSFAVVSGEWWRVERTISSAGSITNAVDETRTLLTGLSDEQRFREDAYRNGACLTKVVRSFDPGTGRETETTDSATGGRVRVERKFGQEVEVWREGAGSVYSYYGPTGKVFVRKRTNATGTGVQDLSVSAVDANGDVFFDWTADRQIPSEIEPRWYSYDYRGNLASTTNELGETIERTFDADGNVLSEEGDAYPVSCAYDSSGRRIELATTRDGEAFDATSWAYDARTGLVRAKTYADGSFVGYSHTPDGLPLRMTNPDGSWTENVYDANRRQIGVTSSDSSCAADFVNDVFGRLTEASNAVASYGYSLSSDGVATNETVSVVETDFGIVRTLDPYGRQIGLSVDGMPVTAIAYATNGLIAAISNDECHVDYHYDAIGGDMGHVLTLSNGVTFSRSLARHAYLRDEVLSVVNVCGGDTNRYDYTYDVLHRPITRNADAFAYNRRGEVTNATVAGQSAAYAYDFIGNFTSVTEDGVTTAYGANARNQYETVDKPGATLEPTYTPNGELAAFGPWTYAYDALSRLTEVRSNGVLVASNSYDHQGRRVRLVTQTAAHTFIYDGWNVVLELVEHDGVTDRIEYCWGKDISGSLQGAGGVGGLLYLKRNGSIYVPIYDAYGNVMEYRSSDGLLAAAYVYDAFGRTISQTCPLADAFRFRYSTKSFDAATGLYYYGKRFYFPELRRWLSRDPIAEDGGGNLCAFCENKPVFLFDMIGLSCKLGTYNVLRLDTWQKSLSNGLASNPDFMDHGNDLLSSIGTLGDLMSLSSLSPSSLANFQSFVDAVAGKGMSPNADVMARLRDLYERLKHGPLRIYGILEYEVCVCKGNKTEFEKQENITDDEDVLNSSDLFEVQNARRKIVKYMINVMYSRIRKQR